MSDRKTLTHEKTPKVIDISSSPNYAAPEYSQCLKRSDEDGLTLDPVQARKTTLDMPSYMAFQIGMALKEFLFKSGVVEHQGEEDYYQKLLSTEPITGFVQNPTNEIQNISLLIQELTKPEPKDRLSIKRVQTFLQKVHLNPLHFKAQLDKAADIELMTKALAADAAEQSITQAHTLSNFDELCTDPKFGIQLDTAHIQKVKGYLQTLDSLLLKKDLEKSSPGRLLLHRITGGWLRVPKVSTLEECASLLPLNSKTRIYMRICASAGSVGLSSDQKEILPRILAASQPPEIHPRTASEPTDASATHATDSTVTTHTHSTAGDPWSGSPTDLMADEATIIHKPDPEGDRLASKSTIIAHDATVMASGEGSMIVNHGDSATAKKASPWSHVMFEASGTLNPVRANSISTTIRQGDAIDAQTKLKKELHHLSHPDAQESSPKEDGASLSSRDSTLK